MKVTNGQRTSTYEEMSVMSVMPQALTMKTEQTKLFYKIGEINLSDELQTMHTPTFLTIVI